MAFEKNIEHVETPSPRPESYVDQLEASAKVDKPDSVKAKDAADNFINKLEKNVKTDDNWREAVKSEGRFSDETLKQMRSPEEYNIYKEAGLEEHKINDKPCLTRNDIDWAQKDTMGRTNKERAEQGLAPIVDGKPLELHHVGQHSDSPLAELTNKEHHSGGNDTVLHDKLKDSEIDRKEFARERAEYWKARAAELGG